MRQALSFTRTGRTELEDDDLMLLDALFDKWASRAALVGDAYPDTVNVAYRPGLSDAELDARLLALRGAGLLASRPGARSRECWGLTVAGGGLWERERDPDWGSYCNVGERLPEDGRWVDVEVIVYAQDTGEAFLRAASESGLYPDMSCWLRPVLKGLFP